MTEGKVFVPVRDTGIGISPEVLPHIFTFKCTFKEFHRAGRGMPRQVEGADLGMAIAKRLAGRMGSRCPVESPPRHGSTSKLQRPSVRPLHDPAR